MNYFAHPASLAVFLGCLSAASLAPAAQPTLCKPSEIPIFSCRLENKKTVSICASPHSAGSYVDYRFGTSSKLELTYSANVDLPHHKFHRGEIVYANNADDTIWFTTGQYRYSVYSPARGRPGLTVSRHGDILARFECDHGGHGATTANDATSPFIVEHGTGDLVTFEKLRQP